MIGGDNRHFHQLSQHKNLRLEKCHFAGLLMVSRFFTINRQSAIGNYTCRMQMSGLVELYKHCQGHGACVAERFASVFRDTPVSLWRVGEPTPPSRTLICVASYSLPELRMMDQVIATVGNHFNDSEVIHVFNALDVKRMEDWETYFPGIGKVYQTPVFGHWCDGDLTQTASGGIAYDWIERHFGIRIDRKFRIFLN